MSKELDEALKRMVTFPRLPRKRIKSNMPSMSVGIDSSGPQHPAYKRSILACDFDLSNKLKLADHNNLISPYISSGISECMHTQTKTYVGFTESYQYCLRCDKKIIE